MKVGRNDPCPCGSNKKYKQCCLPKEARGKLPLGSRAKALAGAGSAGTPLRSSVGEQAAKPLKAVWINKPAKPVEGVNLIERTFGDAITSTDDTSLQPQYPLEEPTLESDDKEETK
jgi:hypothetical protein